MITKREGPTFTKDFIRSATKAPAQETPFPVSEYEQLVISVWSVEDGYILWATVTWAVGLECSGF